VVNIVVGSVLLLILQTSSLSLYQKALSLFQHQNFKEAKASFQRFLHQNPRDLLIPNTLYYLGRLEQEGEESLNYYQKILRKYSHHSLAPDALYSLAQFYYTKGDYLIAINKYRQLLRNYPRSNLVGEVHYWKGCAFLALNQPDSAQTSFKALTLKFPLSPLVPRAKLHLADFLLEKRKIKEALTEYSKISQDYPHSSISSILLARRAEACEKLGKKGEALSTYQTLRDSFPSYYEARFYSLHLLELETEVLAPLDYIDYPLFPIDNRDSSRMDRYTIQVGAFRNLNTAEFIKDRMSRRGYPVFISPKKSKDGYLYRLWIGSFPNKKEALDFASQLKGLEEKPIIIGKD